jgi:hypothetical protein
MHEIDLNSLLSAITGGVAVFAGIKTDLAVLKVKYAELLRRFSEHEKKAGH